MTKLFMASFISVFALSAQAAYITKCTVSYEKVPGKNYYVNVITPELEQNTPYSIVIKNDRTVSQAAEDLSSAKFAQDANLTDATMVSIYTEKEMAVVISKLNKVGEVDPLTRSSTFSKKLSVQDMRTDVSVSCTRSIEE